MNKSDYESKGGDRQAGDDGAGSNNTLPPIAGGDGLDALLRDWHETNRRAAAAGRDRLLRALRNTVPLDSASAADRATNREPDGSFFAANARMHGSDGRDVRQTGHRRRSAGRFGLLIAAMLALAVMVPQLVPSRLVPRMEASAYAGTTVMCPEGGRLEAVDADGREIGPFVLKHTAVDAQVTGRFVRVNVRQQYLNPYRNKIEAVYTFPLSEFGAVDRMTMTIGSRVIAGEVHERDEAREIYEAARASGRVASLLEQERSNIFTQSVANIEPGFEITIEISYIEQLKEREGEFTFTFPTTVAPRYIPGNDVDGSAQVPDAARITPPYVRPEGDAKGTSHSRDDGGADADRTESRERSLERDSLVAQSGEEEDVELAPATRPGKDLSISVKVDTGGPGITGVDSPLHPITRTDWQSRADGNPRVMSISLAKANEIANRDFVLRWRQTSDTVQEAVFTHTGEQGNFLGLMLQPPSTVAESAVVPRELIFVLDTSGSMSGAPLDAAKRVMNRAIASMRPTDRFNVVTFAGSTRVLWEGTRPASERNIREAMALVGNQRGGGGTEMMTAINAALAPDPVHRDRQGRGEDAALRLGAESLVQPLRIVMFLTDGEVGNDMAIIDAIQRYRGTTRVFSFGVGNSVNRYLLTAAARAGGGASEFVLLPQGGQGPSEGDLDQIVERFTRRTTTPVLTNITLEVSPNLPIFDAQPDLSNIPDVFDVSPVNIVARYADLEQPISGTVTIRGMTATGPWQKTVPVTLPASGTAPSNDVLATLWAKQRIEALLELDLAGAQRGQISDEIRSQIVQLGVSFSIMSQYTSFVAVDKLSVTIDGQPQLINIPVRIPDQTDWENYFGLETEQLRAATSVQHAPPLRDDDAVLNEAEYHGVTAQADLAAAGSAGEKGARTPATAEPSTASEVVPTSPAPMPAGGVGLETGGTPKDEAKKQAAKEARPHASRDDSRGASKAEDDGSPAAKSPRRSQAALHPVTNAGPHIGASVPQSESLAPTQAAPSRSRQAADAADPGSGTGGPKSKADRSTTAPSAVRYENLSWSSGFATAQSAPAAIANSRSKQAAPRQMVAAAEVLRNGRLMQMHQVSHRESGEQAAVNIQGQTIDVLKEEPLVQQWNSIASLPAAPDQAARLAAIQRAAEDEFHRYAQAVNKLDDSLVDALDPGWVRANRLNLQARSSQVQSVDQSLSDNSGQSADRQADGALREQAASSPVVDAEAATPIDFTVVLPDPTTVVILMTEVTARTLEQLKAAGLEVLSSSEGDRVVVGRIRLDDIRALTELGAVLRIEPIRQAMRQRPAGAPPSSVQPTPNTAPPPKR